MSWDYLWRWLTVSVHAPNGVFQPMDDHIGGPLGGMTMSGMLPLHDRLCRNQTKTHAAPDGIPPIDKKHLTLCEEQDFRRDMSVDSRGDLLDENESQDSSLNKEPKRHSLFQRLFGRKTKGMHSLPKDNRILTTQAYHAQSPPPTAAKN